MCCNKRRAAAYRGYPPALEAAGPAFGPAYGRRGCGSGQRRPGLIQKLVTKAIEKRNEKMVRRIPNAYLSNIPHRSSDLTENLSLTPSIRRLANNWKRHATFLNN